MDKNFHLAIICDGNRRWAKAKGLMPWEGHRIAIENFRAIGDWARDHARIGTLTLWGFSTENWKRDEKEVFELMRLFTWFMEKEIDHVIERKTRFVHAGRKDRIPPALAALFRDAEERTKHFDGFTIQLAIDHGGKDEIVRAVNRIPAGTPVTEEAIAANIDHPDVPDIDLVIRTSGEQRTSGFSMWKAAYAEWMFPAYHFPDLDPGKLEEALAEYDGRKRRFGK
jgi:undecaprenyl diphosphate synthase